MNILYWDIGGVCATPPLVISYVISDGNYRPPPQHFSSSCATDYFS